MSQTGSTGLDLYFNLVCQLDHLKSIIEVLLSVPGKAFPERIN